MKKKSLLLLALFTMIFVTGCFEKKEVELSPIDVLGKSIENLKDVKSLEVVSTIKAKYEQDGVSVNIEIPFSVSTSEDKDSFAMKMAIGDNMFIGARDAYFLEDSTTNSLNIYFPSTICNMFLGTNSEDEVWLYYNMTLDEITDSTEDVDFEESLEKIKNLDYKKVIGENFVYVDSNEGINHYQLTLNDALVQRLATELGQEIDKMEGEIKLHVYISQEYYNITKITTDLKDMLVANADEEDVETINESIEEFSLSFEFKNINNTNVTMPEEIRNNAVEAAEYIANNLEIEE